MSSNRIGRINDEIQKELSALLRTVKDPRVTDRMLTITHVDRKSTRLNSSHKVQSRMPSSA